MNMRIVEQRRGRVVSVKLYLNGILQGGRVSILAGDDLDEYKPKFQAVMTASGEHWCTYAGKGWRTPECVLEKYQHSLFNLIYGGDPVYEHEDQAVEALIPTFEGTWLTRFLKKGGRLTEGSRSHWTRTILDEEE